MGGAGNFAGYSDDNEEYDPAGNTWTRKAAMLTARYLLGAASVGGKLYAIGGFGNAWNANANEEYDPVANAWTTKSAVPIAHEGGVAAVGGKIYVLGRGQQLSEPGRQRRVRPRPAIPGARKADMLTARISPGEVAVEWQDLRSGWIRS